MMKLKEFGTQIRRSIALFVCLVAIGAVITLAATGAEAASEMTVYRDPSCKCCGGWMKSISAEGFQTQNVPTADMDALKQQQGVPDALTSCHTAIVDGYVIEGHVPAADIKRLLAERPHVAGIAVPGMPVGTPGMESGEQHDAFTVFSFDSQGNTESFSQYQ